MSDFRFSQDGALPGHENMARDLALLEAGVCSARVYRWDGLWVSLGRFQRQERALVDPDIPWVRRPTGGRAVLHGHDITVGLAMPYSGVSVAGAYRLAATPLLSALGNCGREVSLGGSYSVPSSKNADCFASTSLYDIVESGSGKKVCGCALRLAQGALLMQASIPFKPPLIDPRSVIVGAAPTELVPWNHDSFAEAFRWVLKSNPLE